ncbi:2'-5' RNA ligase family protein [Sandaracinobacter sp. RS1-74]|uniref:2'-5' RNA ligase family protein n=1 Tax=Sandaracinobacteroides sayramensis TaxID=2913411 RepID=UPI001EDC00ED|nr:2'-5' RNA ligase family protein [Sandaracinobacteroides sayramensis]MCG2841663.1 2'-5' RNA ligase family protein [Sandaracinobacteroides sayramensis]
MAGLWPAGWEAARAEPMAAPLILTLALPPALQRAADERRAIDAPEAARHAPAHISLFRHLPGPSLDTLANDLRALARATPAPSFKLGSPLRREGMWMAPAQSPDADRLRETLASLWHGLLAPGDKAPPRLHLSLARATGRTAAPHALPAGPWRSPALLLWRHGAARWSPLVAFAFHR